MPFNPDLSDLFWSQVILDPDAADDLDADCCWLWTGQKTRQGYGQFRLGSHGKRVGAHRFAYTDTVGPIPEGYEIDHYRCHRHDCVRPEHLEAVTPEEHRRRDAEAPPRVFPSCPAGHPLDEVNTYWVGDERRCRLCTREKRVQARRRPVGAKGYRNLPPHIRKPHA